MLASSPHLHLNVASSKAEERSMRACGSVAASSSRQAGRQLK